MVYPRKSIMGSGNLKYYVINKPFRVLSQFTPLEGKQCLSDYFNFEKDVYSIGRLDYDSEGLLLLTNDKHLKAFIQEPANKISKQYLVQTEGAFTSNAARLLEKGIEIKTDKGFYKTKPCKVDILSSEPNLHDRNPPVRFRKNIPTSWVCITLSEGKNRQIRKMTAKTGFPTLRIVRIKIGHVGFEGLLPGQYRELTKNELAGFRL